MAAYDPKPEDFRINTYNEEIEGLFGKAIADDILPETQLIERKKVQILGDKYVHPSIRPIYHEVANSDHTSKEWALILYFVLSCKYIEKHKVGVVYNTVYEILTGKRLRSQTFERTIDPVDRLLWHKDQSR